MERSNQNAALNNGEDLAIERTNQNVAFCEGKARERTIQNAAFNKVGRCTNVKGPIRMQNLPRERSHQLQGPIRMQNFLDQSECSIT